MDKKNLIMDYFINLERDKMRPRNKDINKINSIIDLMKEYSVIQDKIAESLIDIEENHLNSLNSKDHSIGEKIKFIRILVERLVNTRSTIKYVEELIRDRKISEDDETIILRNNDTKLDNKLVMYSSIKIILKKCEKLNYEKLGIVNSEVLSQYGNMNSNYNTNEMLQERFLYDLAKEKKEILFREASTVYDMLAKDVENDRKSRSNFLFFYNYDNCHCICEGEAYIFHVYISDILRLYLLSHYYSSCYDYHIYHIK